MLNLNGGNNQNLQPNFIRFVITIFCLGITLGSGLGYGFKQGTDSTPQSTTRTVTQGQNQSFGLAEYIRLEGATKEL